MANERRLIYVDTLKNCIKKRLSNEAIIGWLSSIIDTCPTVDAVEVVRCKDCKYGEKGEDGWFLCHYEGMTWNPADHFCAYGERKSGTQPQREDV